MADNKTSVIITADASQFERELGRVASLATGAGSKMADAFKGVGLAMAGIGAGVGLNTLKEKFDQVIASASGLKELSDRTGASVENLSGLAAVAKVTATDMGTVETAMNRLSKSIHATDDESKGAGKALDFLGIKIKDLRGKDAAENFKLIADKMAEVEDGTGKVALAMALFGKNGAAVLAFMKDLAESGDLVVKTTTDQATAAKNYEEDLRRLALTKEALYKIVSLELAPAFDTFVRALIGAKNETGGMIEAGRQLANDGSIREWGLQAVKVAGFVVDAFDGVARAVKIVGITIGAAAAQASQLAQGNLSGALAIGAQWQQDSKDILGSPLFSQKLEKQTDALRAHWAQVEFVKKAYASFPKNIQDKALKALNDSFYGTIPTNKSASGFVNDAGSDKGTKGGKERDDYTRLTQSLTEKIAVETAALDSTEKLNAAQKDYAKFQADIASGAVKLTAAQKSVIEAYYQVYIARQKENEFKNNVEKQTEATRQQTVALQDRIRTLDNEAATAGLSERAIASMTVSRLEEAVALASSRGATAEQVAVLEEELAIRKKLETSIESRDLARDLSMTKSAQAARDAAKKADYDRALGAGKITEDQHKELLDNLNKEADAMGEFAKKAAQNMQDAMAQFFFDPTQKGMKSLAESFGEMVRKMIAQAAAAQLGKLLFGDLDKTGKLGGVAGDAMGWISKAFSGGSVASAGYDYAAFDALIAGFANGGIMTSAGRLPLTSYAGGGIANRPQLALFGEGRNPEAYVPLPDGKHIPVRMSGGSGGMTVTQHITVGANADRADVKRAAASGARSVLALQSGARRYG